MEGGILKNFISALISKLTGFQYNVVQAKPVPVGVSNRHLHLSQQDLEAVFGTGYQLTKLKDLSQPGQFAAKEVVTIAGPKGSIEQVRVLGPVRKQSQIEVMRSDCFRLGINAPVRESGALAGSAPFTVIGPKGSVYVREGMIVAKRHIHMTPADAAVYGVVDGQVVSMRTGGERAVVFDNVVCRVNDAYALEAHLDLDEANAADVANGDGIYLITNHFSASGGAASATTSPDTMAAPLQAAPSQAAPIPVYNYESLITEEMAKTALRDGKPIFAAAGAVFTPLAKDVISEHEIEVVRE